MQQVQLTRRLVILLENKEIIPQSMKPTLFEGSPRETKIKAY